MSKISLFKTAKRLYFRFAALLAALFLAVASCDFPDPFFVPVTAIEGVPATGTAGTPLTLTATVRPGFANNSDIVWTVADAGTTGASVSGNVLSASANGTVLVKAKIANGKGEGKDYTQDFSIVFSGGLQIAGISIKTQPSKLIYAHGETLDLSGLAVTLEYDDDATEDVEYFQFASQGITADPAHGTELSLSTHNGTAVMISAGDYSAATNKLTVTKAAGAAVTAPTVNGTPTQNSITVNTVNTVTVTGQTVEYAILQVNNGSPSTWQGGTTFTGLNANTTYYVYARSAETANYNAGTARVSAEITTAAAIIPVTGVTLNKSDTYLTVGAQETLTATVLPANATNKAVTWSSNDVHGAAVSANGIVTAVAPGDMIITVKTADGNYTASCTVNVSLPSAADVTFPTAAAITYGAALSTSILSGGSAGRGSFVWQTPSTIPTVTNSGYLMEFTPNDGLDYSGVAGWDGSKVVRTVSITVNKKSVTITPTAGQSKTYGAADPIFAYTPSETLLSGNTFSGALAYTGTNAGTYPFTLGTLSAGNNYTLVLGGSVTFAIIKAAGAAVGTPTVNGTPTSNSITVNTVNTVTVTGQTVEYAISTANNGTGLSAYQSGTTFTVLNANTTYYVYARSASNANYNEGTANVSAGIKTALASAAEVTFPTAAAITYGAALSTSILSGGSAGRGSFAWQTPSTIPTVTNSGYLMEFTPTDGLDYSGVTGWDGSKVVRTVSITVNKKSVTITPATGQSKTYGAADPTFEYTPSESLLSGNTFSGALAYTGTNVGTYPFTLGSLSAGNNYTLVLGGNVTFAINKAAGAAVSTPTVSTSTPPKSTSITVNTVTAPANGQTVEYAISTASNGTSLSAYQNGTVFSGLNANTTYYVYARSASNTNYNAGTASVSAGIKTALASAADVTFPTAAAITYGAALSTSALSDGSAGRGSFVWQTPSTIPTVTNSGYLIEFTPNDAYDYSAVDGWDGSKVVRTVAITVNKKSVTITPTTGQSKTYGTADPTFDYTPSESLLSGNTFSGALAYTGTNAGTYPFTLGTLSAGNNYTLVLGGNVTFAITKAVGAAVTQPAVNGTPTSDSITVNTVILQTATGQSVEYAILTVNNGSPTSWQSGTTFSGLNANTTYYAYARSASNANYNEGTTSVSAGIKTALASAADVTFPTAAAITYGAALSTSILSGGSAGRGTFVWQTPSEIPTVTNSGYLMEFTPNDSYDYSAVDGWNGSKVVRTVSITVNKKSVTITPTAGQSKTYGAADPTFEYTPSETLLSGNTFIGVLAYTGTNVGTYPFTLGTLSAGNNYTLVLGGNVTFAITKAAGAAVSTPAVSGSPTSTSITVNAVTLQTATGQSVEYAISTANNGTSLSAYQSGTTFSGLNANTTYYVYARSASNANYNEGTANVSAGIKTALASAADVTFPTAAAITYGAALSTSTLSGGSVGRGTFTWQTPSTIPTVTNSGYLMEFTPNDSYDYSAIDGWNGSKVVRTVAITVNKAAGAAVTTPTVSTGTPPTSVSITVNAASLQTQTGQSVEYAILTVNNGSPTSWQSGTTFTRLIANTTYYVYARSASNANYNEGTANVSAGITTTAISIEMVLIPAGTFMMGSPAGEPDRQSNETQHQVTLMSGFYMGKYQVTQEQWEAVTGKTIQEQQGGSNDYGRGENYPIYYVSWYDTVEFCNKLSIMKELNPVYSLNGKTNPNEWGTKGTGWNTIVMDMSKNGYRLPTEAEWEYACRGDYPNKATETNTMPFGIGDGTKMVNGMASFEFKYPYDLNHAPPGEYNDSGAPDLSKAAAVGTYQANNYGLYDMHGNMWEWCWDWYKANITADNIDPTGAVTGTNRVLRGGSWRSHGFVLRSAVRLDVPPSYSDSDYGFRLVRSAQ